MTPTRLRGFAPGFGAYTQSPRRRLRLILGVLVLLPLLVGTQAAGADPVADKRAEADRVSRQLDALGLRVSQLAEQFDEARLNADRLNGRLEQVKAAISQADGQIAGARNRVRDLAVNSYMHGGSAAELALFVPHSTAELSVRDTYVRTVAAGANDAIDSLRLAHAQLGEQQTALSDAQTSAARALSLVEAARKAATAADADQRLALTKVQGQLATLVAQADAKRHADEAARLEAAVATREAAAQQRVRSGSGLRGGTGGGADFALAPPGPGASGAITAARQQLGKPYVWGGGGPSVFDCSGLTAWAWDHAGKSLPHSSQAQYAETTHVPISQLQPGDLVFYGMPPHHVGIYVGGGQMINALHSGAPVEYNSIYFEGDLVGGGRVN